MVRQTPRYPLGPVIRFDLSHKIAAALESLVSDGTLPAAEYGVPEVADTKDESHGDYACNIAMVSAKKAGKSPRELAILIAEVLAREPEFEAVEVAGPGFLNLRLKPEFVAGYVGRILDLGEDLPKVECRGSTGESDRPSTLDPRPSQKINVEFVSVNPNGPITVGSGRGAAFGSTLCNVLAAAGHEVHREYYINDGTNSEQMRLFAESVRAVALGRPIPEGGYKGDYIKDVARKISAIAEKPGSGLQHLRYVIDNLNSDQHKFELAISRESRRQLLQRAFELRSRWGEATDNESEVLVRLRDLSLSDWQRWSEEATIHVQSNDLGTFGVEFDTWFSEQSLHDSGTVEKCIQDLQAKGVADEEPYRTLLKMARGGVIEEVVREEQAGDEEEPEVDTHSDNPADVDPQSTIRNPQLSPEPPPPSPTSSDGTNHPPQGEGISTLWLRSTKFADDMDRVLRRKDGRLTYIASDVAYHKDKLLDDSGVRKTGPVDKMITILGPDHHGYIHRLQAVLAALLEKVEGRGSNGESEPPSIAGMVRAREGEGAGGGGLSEIEAAIYRSPEERDACQAALEEARRKLEVVIFQIVRFVKDGKPAPMRKRDGNIYALIDLINELGKNIAPTAPIEEQQRIGKDVARFFYLMRSHETHMDFDIDLATKQSEENPVFYAQYAHARICSILEKAKNDCRLWILDFGLNPDAIQNLKSKIQNPKELALIKKICDLPFEVARCAEDYGVHRLTTYAVELARAFHHFYDACRVIEPDQPEQTQARLALCEATKIGLRGVFDLLGISAPEKMERAESPAAEPSKNI